MHALVICSTIIEHIEELCQSREGAHLAYYYFDFSNQESQNINTLLRCLLWQLCKHEQTIPSSMWKLYETHDSGRKHVRDHVLADALFEMLISPAQSYVVIDALDELPLESRSEFFDLLIDRMNQQEHQNQNYNFLFTSRKEPDIQERMEGLAVSVHNVSIPAGCVNADVRLHVKRFIAEHRGMKNFPASLKKEIEDTLSSKAQGM